MHASGASPDPGCDSAAISQAISGYSADMLQLLLFIRTAIGILAGVLAWYLIARFIPMLPELRPLVTPFAAGFVGGLTCMSLSPAQGLRLAATCGVIMCLLTLIPLRTAEPWHWWSAMLIPGYLSGASGWLALARMVQNR